MFVQYATTKYKCNNYFYYCVIFKCSSQWFYSAEMEWNICVNTVTNNTIYKLKIVSFRLSTQIIGGNNAFALNSNENINFKHSADWKKWLNSLNKCLQWKPNGKFTQESETTKWKRIHSKSIENVRRELYKQHKLLKTRSTLYYAERVATIYTCLLNENGAWNSVRRKN